MEPKRWQLVKHILDQALDVEKGELPSLMVALCHDDKALQREVESLLRGREKVDRFFDDPLLRLRFADTTDFSSIEHPDEQQGFRIGPYELREPIGRGGMGAVYLATRIDQEYEGQVAIKILKRGMDSAEIVHRFRNERQILANLNHNHIARLYDGGTTDDGRPYLVMEYVDGTTVDVYCDQHRLSAYQRLKIFLQICEAVDFAHRNFVVHRDLKPGNILVTVDGVPKLLDFGIAKLLAPEVGSNFTADQGLRIMTPAYASPEQIRGEAVTTASDTYSLGVLLYELLTGRRPFHLPTSQWVEAARLLEEQEPVPPSVVVSRHQEMLLPDGSKKSITPEQVSENRSTSPGKLRKLLLGDIDSILIKALKKNPSDRYSSAADLLDDLRRFLSGRPVSAQRLTVGYKTAKFLRRHRVAIGVLLAVFLALGSVLYAGMQRAKAERELLHSMDQQKKARLETRKAEKLEDFLILFLSGSDPDKERWRNARLRDVLDRGAALVPDELDSIPEVQSTLSSTIGRVYHSLGLFSRARPLLEASLRARLEILGPQHEQVAYSEIHLGRLYTDLRLLDRAEELTRRGLRSLRNADSAQQPWILKAENNLAAIFQMRGDLAAAETLYLKVLNRKRKFHGKEHPAVALGLHNLAAVVAEQGRYEEAKELYTQSIAMREVLGTTESQSMAKTLSNLGVLMQSQMDLDKASDLFHRSLGIRRRLFPRGDNRGIAITLNNLGVTQHLLRDLEMAGESFDSVLEILEKAGSEGVLLGIVLRNQASLIVDEGAFDRADLKIRQAIRILERNLQDDSWRLADARSVLGGVLTGMERFTEAEQLLTDTLKILRAQSAACPRQFREASQRLRDLYTKWDRSDASRSL